MICARLVNSQKTAGASMTVGTCKLCLKENQELLKSHLMPSALYGSRKKELEVTTRSGTFMTKEHVKQYLLCRDCEQRFDQNGETHVLEIIAPKNTKAFSLNDRMRIGYARDHNQSAPRFHGPDFGIDTSRFA
jgi:hypothetical protein